ncbi:uncharacterized protein LOC123552067 [Mercenaria mercenaria]|uniref:uncharacterized protein LOC123552067 n=1 Tax=Mercenaria mercenaria TaxID=6596 RepID=UPI00234E5CF0|nr:uncharacterized protein LOC123552067 [Mercenaria mercenaria]
MDNYNDNISIISLNSSRKGLLAMPQDDQVNYLNSIFENAPPDICFLPGDDKMAKLNVIRGYKQFTIPNAKDTVLLYDTSRITMKKPNVSFNSFGPMPGLDFNKMVVPQVEVFTLKPCQRVVKEFSIVSWTFDFFETAPVQPETLVESIIIFAQQLAKITRIPVLIGGEMSIDHRKLNEIVKKVSKDSQEEFLASIHPEMSENEYLPSMTKASSRNQRHLFMMNVYRCEANGANGSVEQSVGGNTSDQVVADCFIASKTLHLTEPTFLDFNEVTGRKIRMESLQKYKPTQSSMEIPVRPPKHNGG